MILNPITVITPTGDRYDSIRLLVRFMLDQDYRGLVEWVIVDDGETDKVAQALEDEQAYRFLPNKGISIDHVKRPFRREEIGPRSLAQNLLAGLERVNCPKTIIMEDDDCYHYWHIRELATRLELADATGTVWQKYYHLPSMSHKTWKNVGSALCCTGLRSSLVPNLAQAARDCYKTSAKGIDGTFWKRLLADDSKTLDVYDPPADSVVGMKGLPGRTGIGVGHRPTSSFTRDPRGNTLKQWTMKHAGTYLHIRETGTLR